MSEVDIDTFARAKEAGGQVIDVREPQEYLSGHVPGAKLIPMTQLPARLEEIEKQPVYVVCASGNRSLAVTHFLRSAGYEAYSVARRHRRLGQGRPAGRPGTRAGLNHGEDHPHRHAQPGRPKLSGPRRCDGLRGRPAA